MLSRKLSIAFIFMVFVHGAVQANTPTSKMTQTKMFPSVVETTIKRGQNRSMGEISFLAPFRQQSDKIHFFNYIGKRSNIGGAEFNLGYGTRTVRNNAVHGYYGFFDVRRTPSTNTFYQLTLGREKLSKNFDYRINGYVPLSGKKSMLNTVRDKEVVETSGGGLSVVSDHYEYPMGGIDLEVGKKFSTGSREIGVWGGAYYFGHKAVKNIYGPMIRAEITQAFERSRIKFGMQYQNDTVRGKNFISQLTFSMDLYDTPKSTSVQKSRQKPSRKTLSYLQRRMLDPVVRDVDIVTNRDKITETPKSLATGKQLKKIVRVTKGSELFNSTNNGEQNTLVVVENDIKTSLEIKPKAGQVLVSGEKKLILTTDSGVVMTMRVGTGKQKKITAKTNNQKVMQNMTGALVTGIKVQNKLANGTVVNAPADLPAGIKEQVEKEKTYNFLRTEPGKYKFSKQCEPGESGKNCRKNVTVDPKTGAFTLKRSAEELSMFAIVATDAGGNRHQIMTKVSTPYAKQLAEKQQQNTLPNEETYKGIRLLYGNDFKCSKDKGVFMTSGGSACGNGGKTKIRYVKDVIDGYLDPNHNPNAEKIIAALKKNQATMTLFNKKDDKKKVVVFRELMGNNQDLQADETFVTAGNDGKGLSKDGSARNAALEEVVHLIQNYGMDYAVPDWQERLNDATDKALRDDKLNWQDKGEYGEYEENGKEKKGVIPGSNPDGTSDDDNALPRRDLDDEYFADAVEAYFNMRGGRGYIKDTFVCSSGGLGDGLRTCGKGDAAGTTAREELELNHKVVYDLVEEMFGKNRKKFFLTE